MIHFDEHIFQMGWFNHQLDLFVGVVYKTPSGFSWPLASDRYRWPIAIEAIGEVILQTRGWQMYQAAAKHSLMVVNEGGKLQSWSR